MNKIIVAKSPAGNPVLIFTDGQGNLIYRQLNGQPYTGSCDDLTYECCSGKSPYDLAVENGFTGTEQEWLYSLRGSDGQDGINGIDGVDGTDGVDGITPQPIWNGTELSWDLTGDGNADTTPVDLQGPSGSGGGSADNWGTQVVVSDGTLTGDGTSTNPLSVDGSTLQVDWSNIQNIPADIADGDDVGTPGSGEQNVQADWNETDNTSDAFILNKPIINDSVSTFQQNTSNGEITHNDGSGGTDVTAQVTSADSGNLITTGTDGGSFLDSRAVSGDNWGTQVIEHAGTSISSGDGTTTSPLNVEVDWSDINNIPSNVTNSVEGLTVGDNDRIEIKDTSIVSIQQSTIGPDGPGNTFTWNGTPVSSDGVYLLNIGVNSRGTAGSGKGDFYINIYVDGTLSSSEILRRPDFSESTHLYANTTVILPIDASDSVQIDFIYRKTTGNNLASLSLKDIHLDVSKIY